MTDEISVGPSHRATGGVRTRAPLPPAAPNTISLTVPGREFQLKHAPPFEHPTRSHPVVTRVTGRPISSRLAGSVHVSQNFDLPSFPFYLPLSSHSH